MIHMTCTKMVEWPCCWWQQQWDILGSTRMWSIMVLTDGFCCGGSASVAAYLNKMCLKLCNMTSDHCHILVNSNFDEFNTVEIIKQNIWQPKKNNTQSETSKFSGVNSIQLKWIFRHDVHDEHNDGGIAMTVVVLMVAMMT